MQVVTVQVAHLGNRCHLVHDGSVALVVDPPRDLGAVEGAAQEAGVEIAAVADTHVHNDYVSGALGLARRHGADYLLAADESVAFERVGVRGGDVVDVGALEVHVIDTPGHTRHHQSFHVLGSSGPGALFSGGSLLHGTVGRTDLVDDALTRRLAGHQWDSARAQGSLHPATRLHPTHGFGSFCASSPASTTASTTEGEVTVGDQRVSNPALTQGRDRFIEALVTGFGPVPAYYRHMAPLNRTGAGRRPGRSARRVTAAELEGALTDGAWVIDLRDRVSFAAGHRRGSVSVEYSQQFATYVGWLVPWGEELIVTSDHLPDLAPALRDLASIGIEGVGTHVSDPVAAEAAYRRTDWAGFRSGPDERVVVDVRQRDEFEAGHLPGALHVPVQDVERRATQLPPGELWVHCRSGYRAGIAASLLHRAGRDVVHVDDTWDRVAELAIPTTGHVAA